MQLPAFALAIFVCSGCFSNPVFSDVTWQSKRQTTAGYSGFELPLDLEWEGETEVVRYVPPRNTSGTWQSGATMSGGEWMEIELWSAGIAPPIVKQRPPIELLEYSHSHAARAYAKVAETPDDVGIARRSQYQRDNDTELATYAHVVNSHGTLLGFGEAFSTESSFADDFSLQADGSMWRRSDLLASLDGEATNVNSSGTADVYAEYHLTQSFDFILNIDLATEDLDADYSFLLRDLTSDETILELEVMPGRQRTFQYCGTLAPGTYDLKLSASSKSTANTVEPIDLGGFGEYKIDLRMHNPHGEIVPVLHPSERRIPGVQYRDELFAGAQGEPPVMVASVPEPKLNSFILCGLFVTIMLRRYQQRCGVERR